MLLFRKLFYKALIILKWGMMKINKVAELRRFFEGNEAGVDRLMEVYDGSLLEIDQKLVRRNIIPRSSFAHKGSFGHVLIIAGHEGTPGASILCSKAALRSGCGLVTALVPQEAIFPLLVHLPESMVLSRGHFAHLATGGLSRFNAIGFGPGAGTGDESAAMLHYLLNNYNGPLIIDADGLTILSKNKEWFSLLKGNIILTPHPAEFDRLTVKHGSAVERIEAQANFSKQYGAHVLLKGHHTSVVTNGMIWFNTTGNNGMATAGSGDVLTGIITSLCAQGYEAGIAAVMAVYLHGYAGDVAAKKHSMHSMIAGDIIDGIGKFFKKFEKASSE